MIYYGGKIMCKACEVGRIVVNKCLANGLYINTQKLQKLLVLMQVECVIQNKKCLFEEDIVIWDCGVAIKEVDAAFRGNGTGFTEGQTEYITLLKTEEKCVDFVISRYGHMNATEIAQLDIIKGLVSMGQKRLGSGALHISTKLLLETFANDNN